MVMMMILVCSGVMVETLVLNLLDALREQKVTGKVVARLDPVLSTIESHVLAWRHVHLTKELGKYLQVYLPTTMSVQ